MRLILYTILIASASSAAAELGARSFRDFNSPDGHYAVHLREGWTIGNCKYDQANLIDARSKKVLFIFTPLGGYEDNSVVWAPKSKSVSVYSHDHRSGEPQVVRITCFGVRMCSIPEITLPHEKNAANDGRQWQSWLKPTKWLSESTLLLNDSGVIQQQKGVQANITYEYEVQIDFDPKRRGVVKSTKRLQFEKDDTWR